MCRFMYICEGSSIHTFMKISFRFVRGFLIDFNEDYECRMSSLHLLFKGLFRVPSKVFYEFFNETKKLFCDILAIKCFRTL